MGRSRVARLAAVSAVVLALAVGPVVAPAIALAPASFASAAEPLPYIPSGSKWRQYMINVLSSVLGAATPNKWKAEQIANVYRYDGGFETLNQKFGIDGIRMNEAGQITGVKYSNKGAGTYTDVVIAGLEEQYKKQSVTGKGPVRAPATPIKSTLKVVGGAASVFFAYDMGAMLGAAGVNVLGGAMFGFDANGAVCGAQGFEDGFLGDAQKVVFRFMSGQDCSSWDLAPTYVVNSDVDGTWSSSTYNGGSIRLVGFMDLGVPQSQYWSHNACYAYVQPTSINSTQIGIGYKAPNGTWNNVYFSLATDTCQGFGSSPMPGVNRSLITDTKNTPWSAQAGWPKGVVTFYNRTTNEAISMPVEERGDPDRQQVCDVEYTDGTHQTQLGPVYKESAGAVPPAICPGTPEGKTPETVTVTDTGQSPGADPIYQEDVNPEYQEWWEQYPECRGGGCALDILRLAPSPAVSCFDIDEGCPDWADDPNKTENYQCRYGVHNVPLDECNVYAGVFKPGRTATGSPYSDPTTGEWSGGQNAPSSRNSNMQRVLQDPTNLRSCDFADVGFDPVGWILRGGQCLAEWTFVARPAVVDAHFAGVEESFTATGPGKLSTAVGSWAFVPPGGGCEGLTIPWSQTLGHNVPDWNILNACAGSPLQPAAVASTVVLSIGAVLGLIFALTRAFGGVVGYGGLGGGRVD